MDINTLIPYGIAVVKAVVVAFIGWIIAVVGRKITVSILNQFESLKKQKELVKSAGNLVYYLILLITVVAVLEALGLKYVTQPFLDLLNKIAGYIPNIIGATIILIVGVFLARIAKEFTNALVETVRLEEFAKKYGIEDLGGALGNLVYVFVLLFVVISALNALQIESITKPATAMLSSILNAIPKIAAAIIIFGIAFYIGKVLADIAANIVDELNIDEIAKEIGISSEKRKFADLVRYLVIAFAVLIGLTQAFNYLNAEALYRITYSFTLISFKLVVAIAILFAGLYFGNLIEKRVENEKLGKVLKFAFAVAAVFIALPYVGISPEIIEIVVLSISLGFGIAFAIAFGIGGKEVAAELLRKLVQDKEEK